MCGSSVKGFLGDAYHDLRRLSVGRQLGLPQPGADAIEGMLNPVAVPVPDQLVPTQDNGAVTEDSASLIANQRERRRAARRFGRASTIGAGSVGAPTTGGKTAIGM